MNDRSMTVVNDDELCSAIHQAQSRLVLLSPGVSAHVAHAIAVACARIPPEPQGQVAVIVDTEDEVFLTGLGEFEALHILRVALAGRGDALGCQPGVRLGVLIADDTTLIWSPTPLLIQASPQQAALTDPRHLRPNAIRLETPPPAVASALGAGEAGLRERRVGLDPVESAKVEQVRERLKVNPPQKFDVAQRVRTFNAFFQFVELEMAGVELRRRTAPLPSDLFGLADEATRRQLRASFHVVPEADKALGLELVDAKRQVVKEFLRLIPGHGWVLLRTERDGFDQAVAGLRQRIEQFKKVLAGNLQTRMDAQRAQLFDALWPNVCKHSPRRYVESWWSDQSEKGLRRLLERDLDCAFGTADDLIRGISLKCVFKDVTYESLQDEQFMSKVRLAVPELPQHHEEQDAALSLQQEPGPIEAAA